MQVHLLKSVVVSIAGNQAGGIVEILYGKKNVNEFFIAKKLKMTINQARNVLYKLSDEGIVSFIRKKDSKKGGWYIYYWTLNLGSGLVRFKEALVKNIENVQKNLSQLKTGRFFHCKNCALEFNEEVALSNTYLCTECGSVLEIKDVQPVIAQFEKEIHKMNETLKEIDGQISEVTDKETKTKTRRIKAEIKKKADERMKKRTEKKKLLGKMSVKKKVKKHAKKSSSRKSKFKKKRK